MANTTLFTPKGPSIVRAYTAGADLSSSQFLGVVVGSTLAVTVAASATAKAGVLINAPESGGKAQVQFFGDSFCILAGSTGAGRTSFRFNNAGKAVAATTGQSAAGYVELSATTAADTTVPCVLYQHVAE